MLRPQLQPHTLLPQAFRVTACQKWGRFPQDSVVVDPAYGALSHCLFHREQHLQALMSECMVLGAILQRSISSSSS